MIKWKGKSNKGDICHYFVEKVEGGYLLNVLTLTQYPHEYLNSQIIRKYRNHFVILGESFYKKETWEAVVGAIKLLEK